MSILNSEAKVQILSVLILSLYGIHNFCLSYTQFLPFVYRILQNKIKISMF